MAEFTSHPKGTFSWPELATTDQKAGVAFYRSLFGWDVNEQPLGPGETYSMFQLRGKEVGAAYTMRPEERQSGAPPHWNAYVTVESADEAVKTPQELGGKVFAPPFDVMDAGRMAVLQDPTGAVFQVWEPKQEHRREDSGRAGRALLDRARRLATRRAPGSSTRSSSDGPPKKAAQTPAPVWNTPSSACGGKPAIGMMSMPAQVPAARACRTGCHIFRSPTATRQRLKRRSLAAR